MLERLSTSQHDSSVHRHFRAKSERFHVPVFGSKKQATFQVVITELRAELMNAKQSAPGHPCVLQWVRGDTVHVTDDSVGQTVLSWSDTYFAQVVTFQLSSSGGFRAKECKFKVQQKGKTVAKTAVLDLSKFCSEVGVAREQAVSLPLQPVGTLYFVIATSLASDPKQQSSEAHSRQQPHAHPAPSESLNSSWQDTLASQSTSILASTAHAATPGGGGCGPTSSAATGGASSSNTDAHLGLVTSAAAAADTRRPSVNSTRGSKDAVLGALPVTPVSSAVGASSGSSVLERLSGLPHEPADRPSSSGIRPEAARKHAGTGTGTGMGSAAAITDADRASATSSASIFRRIVRGGGGAGGGKLSPASLSAGASPAQHRQSDGATRKAAAGGGAIGLEPKLDRKTVTAMGSYGGGASCGEAQAPISERVVRSASCTPGPVCKSASAAQLDCGSTGGGAKVKDIARISAGASNSNSSRSDTGTAPPAIGASKGGAAGAAAAAGENGGGGGWGAWLRHGLGWGRGSSHSATGTSTTGALSTTSIAGTGTGGGGLAAGGAANVAAAAALPPALPIITVPEPDSSALEAAIRTAAEPAELRDFALDLLHERDEWRHRVLGLQEALARAQKARPPASREVQRLELRIRQYQDELRRRKDGTLLQELVDAKIRIAELCNENMKMRRQIIHMGPLLYDDSGDDAAMVDARDT